MDVTALLSITFIYFCIFLIINHIRKGPKPPGPWGFPIIGHLPFFGGNLPKIFRKWRQQYGDVFRIRMGMWDAVVINGYSAVKEALEKYGDTFSGRPDFLTARLLTKERNGSEDSLSFGKFTPAYMLHRKLVVNAFRVITKTKVVDTQELILDEANKMIEQFLSWNSKPGYVGKAVRRSIANIIYQIIYKRGQNSDEDKQFSALLETGDEINIFAQNGNIVDSIPWLRFFMPWELRKFVDQLAVEEAVRKDIVEQRMLQRNTDACTITDLFLDTKLPEEVKDKHTYVNKARLMRSLNDLVGAGDDNTHVLLSWSILYMIVYPEVQKRVQTEIDDIIGISRLEFIDRSRLKYTWATLLEVMRITTMVPFSLPHSTTTNTELNGLRIDKDSVVLFNLLSIHMDELFWTDPENFRPERFLDGGNEILKEKVKHVVPFGLGRRRCLGEQLAKMELFLLFTTLMQKCSFSKYEKDIISTEPVRELVYRPQPYRAVVKKRD